MTQAQTQRVGHTPGPWTIEGDINYYSIMSAPPMVRIADVLTETNGGENGLADARLIAAAPELLEALRASQPILVVAQHEANKRLDNEMAERCAATCDLIESALAKATS